MKYGDDEYNKILSDTKANPQVHRVLVDKALSIADARVKDIEKELSKLRSYFLPENHGETCQYKVKIAELETRAKNAEDVLEAVLQSSLFKGIVCYVCQKMSGHERQCWLGQALTQPNLAKFAKRRELERAVIRLARYGHDTNENGELLRKEECALCRAFTALDEHEKKEK